jgi:hypothetical protein
MDRILNVACSLSRPVSPRVNAFHSSSYSSCRIRFHYAGSSETLKKGFTLFGTDSVG